MNENVCEGYNFIANNWAPGDEIFLFGFSRGAYTARAIAGLICEVGLLEARFMDAFPEMYQAFQTDTEGKAFKESSWAKTNWEIFNQKLQKDVKIKVVGVFDTVGSLGLPETGPVKLLQLNKAHRFHNTQLDPGEKCRQLCLAIDTDGGGTPQASSTPFTHWLSMNEDIHSVPPCGISPMRRSTFASAGFRVTIPTLAAERPRARRTKPKSMKSHSLGCAIKSPHISPSIVNRSTNISTQRSI